MTPIHTHNANRPKEGKFSTSPRKLSCDVGDHDLCHCQDTVPESRQVTTSPTQLSNRVRKHQRVSITFGGPGSISGSGSGSSCSASTPSSTSSPLFPLFEFYTQSPMCHTASFPLPLKEEQHHPLAPLSPASPLESSTFGLKEATFVSIQTLEAEGQAQDILTSDTSTQDPHNPSRSMAPARDAHARFTFGYGGNSDALSLGTSVVPHPSQSPSNSLKSDFYRSGRYNADLPPLPLSSSVHTPRIQSTTAARVTPSENYNNQRDHGQLERRSPASTSLTQGSGPCATAGDEEPTASDSRKSTCVRRSSLKLSPEIDATQPTLLAPSDSHPSQQPKKKRFSSLANILSTSKGPHTTSSSDRATITADKPLPPVPSSSTSSHGSFLSKPRPRAISTSAASALELDHSNHVPGLDLSHTAASRRHHNYGSNTNHSNNNSNNSYLGAALQEKRPSNASLQAIFNGIQVQPPLEPRYYPTSSIHLGGYFTTGVSSSPSPVPTTASTDVSPGRPSASLGASRDSLMPNTFTSPPPPRPQPPQLKGSGSCDAAEKHYQKKKRSWCGSWSLFCFVVK